MTQTGDLAVRPDRSYCDLLVAFSNVCSARHFGTGGSKVKRSIFNRNPVVSLLVVLSIVLLGNFSVHAEPIPIGAGTGIPLDELDTTGGGPRTNVDLSSPVDLVAGFYQATEFSFAAGRAGQATPFLAVSTGPQTYKVIALGDNAVFDAAATTTVPFGGTDVFSLDATTTVFAGIINPPGSVDNPIWLDNGAGATDHDNADLSPITAVGDVVDGFSHANLGRTYAFSITVDDAIPEPSSLLLASIAFASLGCCALRRRRRAA